MLTTYIHTEESDGSWHVKYDACASFTCRALSQCAVSLKYPLKVFQRSRHWSNADRYPHERTIGRTEIEED